MESLSNPLFDSGVRLLKPKVFEDERGYFFESFNAEFFQKNIANIQFCQDNQSLSRKGVLRGLHFQVGPKSQTKLVRVLKGAVWDVAIDLRISSPTFKQWSGVELSESNQLQLLVPKGFAHGFLTLSDEALVSYKVDEFYSRDHDRGVRFDDPDLDIGWPSVGTLVLSGKDRELPFLKTAELFG